MEQFFVRVAGAGLSIQIAIYLAALAGACWHYRSTIRSRGTRASVRGLLAHLCPPALLRSRWTWVDAAYWVVDRLLGFIILPMTTLLAVGCAGLVLAGLRAWLGAGPLATPGPLGLVAFLVVGLVVRDFLSFFLHMLQHRVPLLWVFHKVHHAPETLVPLTGHRLHPLELCMNLIGDAPFVGSLAGAYAWLGNGGPESLIVCSAGLQLLVGLLTLSPLRHSHIDLRLGRFERFVLSPAHHRLHHSAEPAHWDKNFSAVFPFWDRAWRTLFAPPPSDSYRLGLPGGESDAYVALTGSYVRPFRQAVERSQAEGWAAQMRVGPLAGRPLPRGLDQAWRSVETAHGDR